MKKLYVLKEQKCGEGFQYTLEEAQKMLFLRFSFIFSMNMINLILIIIFMCIFRYKHWNRINHVFDNIDEPISTIARENEQDEIIEDKITDEMIKNTVDDCIKNMECYEREWRSIIKESQEKYDEILKTLVGERNFEKYLQ